MFDWPDPDSVSSAVASCSCSGGLNISHLAVWFRCWLRCSPVPARPDSLLQQVVDYHRRPNPQCRFFKHSPGGKVPPEHRWASLTRNLTS
jgi:hypothetical protein